MIPNARLIEDLFDRLRPLPAGERARLLEPEPPEVRAELESLLAASEAGSLSAAFFANFTAEVLLADRLIEPGRRLGSYEVEECVGRGGSGEVYRAYDARLGRHVAIKRLWEAFSGPEARERFQREMRALAAVRNPHACAVYDTGSEDGCDYLVMEYLEGAPLSAVIADRTITGLRR
jgi:serine/threonine protein kinase